MYFDFDIFSDFSSQTISIDRVFRNTQFQSVVLSESGIDNGDRI